MEIHGILENLCTVEGVLGAYLIGENGEMMDSSANDELDTEYIADLVHRCVKSGNQIAESLYDSPLKQSYIEFSDSSLTLDSLKNGAILALLASSKANLGRIRLELRKTKRNVEKKIS